MKSLLKKGSVLIVFNKNNKALLSLVKGAGPKYIKLSALGRTNYTNVDTESVISQGLIEYVNSSNPEDKIYITSSILQSIKNWSDKHNSNKSNPSS